MILLRGEGKHFSAGMDLANFVNDSSRKNKKDPSRTREAFYHELWLGCHQNQFKLMNYYSFWVQHTCMSMECNC